MHLSFNHVAFHVAVGWYFTPPPLWLADIVEEVCTWQKNVQRECCMSIEKVISDQFIEMNLTAIVPCMFVNIQLIYTSQILS